jgi:pimeloyl-ACP methyl ester carboxylesterase
MSIQEHSPRSTGAARRRRRIAALTAAAVTSVITLGGLSQVSAADDEGHKPNILLVHGAFADGSSWSGVIARLQADGYNVVASQIPLTSFGDDVAAVKRDLRVLRGPTLVVGHSYGGAVITQAARGRNVVGVVYIAAAAPDTGETAADFNRLAPPLPSQADFVPIDLPHVGRNKAPFVVLARDKVQRDFCQDCSVAEARLVAATEVPINYSAFVTPITGTPAWKRVPAWYQISSRDRIVNPAAQRVFAKRIDPSGAHTITLASSHASLISHARQIAGFIERAARASRRRSASPDASAHRRPKN